MRAFAYERPRGAAEAVQMTAGGTMPPTVAPAQFLAGGTTILDLMKLDTMRPLRLVDLGDVAGQFRDISASAGELHLGAFVTMAEAAAHPAIRRDYPLIAQALELAASPQLRNMATLGGNVLQRTRCNYFRDPGWSACNKREPGSGCAALTGVNRKHAVLGVSNKCIATYPGDFAQALIALDAKVEIVGPSGARVLPFGELHVSPDKDPSRETILQPGDLITGFSIPASALARRSLYLKIRDRQSYEFALASAAVALDLDGGSIRDARVALGGVATRPWRSHEAETALRGQPLGEQSFRNAAYAAFVGAQVQNQNSYKPELGRRTLIRALRQVAAMEA
ncbi:MAG TPA: xanthine dehydrogenase family protein subunit M [Rhizomicrobium sp.]|jgi:xanthine dehydrogenase YagS FAD-binding subunit|nr:xanthine dehydrogenase family protein subunit M [Rhizomicrobium sp.]